MFVPHGVGVPLLDEEPLLHFFLDLYQRPLPLALVTAQFEQQLALLETFLRITDGHPHATVPHDDSAGPVVPFGNGALEVSVLHRMGLHVDRQPLVVGIERWALGNRP